VISEDVIAEVLRRTDIVELIGGYLPLRAAGRTHKALCPFHEEKTPSFVVNPERQIFHCFGCGEGGDAISFLVKHERLSFPEALRHLAEKAGVALPAQGRGGPEADGRLNLVEAHRLALAHFRENLAGPEGAAARQYLAGRGLAPALVERFQLGYALNGWDGLLRALKRRGVSEAVLQAAGLVVPRQKGSGHYDRFRHRLMIPIWDPSGKVIGFGGRALAEGEVKYLNSPETPLYRKGLQLYALNLAARAARERKHVIVVEGYFDAITLHAHGFEQAVAALGTALTTDQAKLLARYAPTAFLVFDPDAPGIGAARRSLEHLANLELEWRLVVLPGSLDPDAFLRQHGAPAFQAALDGAQDLVDFFLDRRVSGLDLADPLQRARAVEGLVEVVGALDSPIRREGYIQRIAQRTGITDRGLLEAVARQRARSARPDAPAPAAAAKAAPPREEEQLVAIALQHPGCGARIAQALTPDDFSDPLLREIFVSRIHGAEGGALSLQPPEVERRLAALSAQALGGSEDGEGIDEATVERMVTDCLARIRQRKESREREKHRQAMSAAARGGDQVASVQLLAEHPKAKSATPTDRSST